MKIGDFDFDDLDASHEATASTSHAVTDSIVERFATGLTEHPERLAVHDEDGKLTYQELDFESSRIARFIAALDLGKEALVGVMTGRSRHYITAILGVLKAGCAFVPLDPNMPLIRRVSIVRSAGLPLIVGDGAHIGDLHQLQWRCGSLDHILCLDHDEIDALSETPGSLMSAELWDHLAGDDADNILAGGWKSAFTGQQIPQQVMEAFGANARSKVADVVSQASRVLEIGCASGVTMRHVAPLVGQYVATDISRRNVERTETLAIESGMSHVMGRQLAAHDVDVFEPGSFDLVILNSVIENFPGFGYLRQVLDKVARLLVPGGAIFIGNIWDADRRDAYLADLAAFARENAGKGYDTRLDFLEDLFVPEAFLQDWRAERGGFAAQRTAIDVPGFDPAPYAFDFLLTADDSVLAGSARKRRYARAQLEACSSGAPLAETSADDLAYVLFTSGTTGRPKGVMIEHGSVVNLAQSVFDTQLLLLGADSPGACLDLTCVAPFGFDGSIVQIFAAILNGQCLHVPGFDTRSDPEALHHYIREHGVDQLDVTPSLFALLLDYWEETGESCGARMVVLGGEVVSMDLVERFFALPGHSDIRLVNAYGPTECCVSAAQYVMTAYNFRQILPPPVGKAIQGVTLDICDDQGNSLPDGVPGEIRIGGAGVARGYLGEDDENALKFMKRADGSRWYRSGDVGRRRGDGEIVFVGREDRQVKVRGNRLELGEVENAIARHPLVRRATVKMAEEGQGSSPGIVAYLVTEDGFDAAACRAQLEEVLPSYMLPSCFICVDEIPLTTNGKIDYAKLPSPEKTRPDGMTKPAKPLADAMEHQIAALMGEVLDRSVDDADADFFELGGHSVLAVQFLSRITRETGVKIPLSDLFSCSSVARLSARISERKQAQAAKSPLVPVNSTGSAVPMVCFHPVGGNILCYQALARELGPNQPIYMVEAQGLEEGQSLAPSVEEMVAAYMPHVREVIPEGPVFLAGWSFGGLLAYEAAYRLQQAGVEVQGVFLFDAVAVPDAVRELLRKDEAEYLSDLFAELGIVEAAELRPLTPEGRIDLLLERGKDSKLLPREADRGVIRRLLAVFQNNALAAVHYIPPRLETVDVLLIRPETVISAAPGIEGDDYNGWKNFAGEKVKLEWVPGTHGSMMFDPDIVNVAACIRACIRQEITQA